MLSPRLRRRLSELARTPVSELTGVRGGRAATPAAPSPDSAAPPPEPPAPESLEALVLTYDPAAAGAVQETECGACYRIEVSLSAMLPGGAERAAGFCAAAERLGVAPEGLLLVDIETAGLAAAPLFLIGALTGGPDGLMLTQQLARGQEEEAALLAAFCRSLVTCRMVVTFNGEAFDLPYLRDRAVYHRLPPPLFPDHLDLLPAARRRWRGAFRDCRLQTLEQHVCRRRRHGDVAGSAIPGLYHDFVRTGAWPLLLPVFHHNALDLLTLAELLPHLLDASAQ